MPPAVNTGEAPVAVCVHLQMSYFLAWLSGQVQRRGLKARRHRDSVLCVAACASL